jgi:hypothetical protein
MVGSRASAAAPRDLEPRDGTAGGQLRAPSPIAERSNVAAVMRPIVWEFTLGDVEPQAGLDAGVEQVREVMQQASEDGWQWTKPGSDCNADRVLPGEGILDLPALIAALERHGYDGFFSIELFNEDLWRLPVAEAARRCYRSLLPLCDP